MSEYIPELHGFYVKKRGVTSRERGCGVPRKRNKQKRYLRPYGAGDYGKCACSCRGIGITANSHNHGAQRWRSEVRKAERKSARQQMRQEVPGWYTEWDDYKEMVSDFSYLPPELCPDCAKQRELEFRVTRRRECNTHWNPDDDCNDWTYNRNYTANSPYFYSTADDIDFDPEDYEYRELAILK